ncbi:MAG: hypothetical protein H0W90_16005 [Actinobacteria bacterium]|nr:hypothetical protein [Actinomycetota bacterium]
MQRRRIWLLACLGGVLACSLASALPAATPSLSVSPASIRAGGTIRLSGSADGCTLGSNVFLLSRAFVRRHEFAGVPAALAKVRTGGAFKVWTTIPRARRPGHYVITARCGGGNLGVSVSLRVRRPA